MGLLTGLCPAADNQDVTAPSGKGGGEPAIVETRGLTLTFGGWGRGEAAAHPAASFLPPSSHLCQCPHWPNRGKEGPVAVQPLSREEGTE